MNENTIKVNMLGSFSIEMNGKRIEETDNRSRKSWLLLAYLIYCRSRQIKQEELINLLWENEEDSVNPAGAIKTMLFRVRSSLNNLGDGVGHQLIIHRSGGYCWNTAFPICYDCDEFEKLCLAAEDASDDEKKAELYTTALALYRGDFLPKLSMESWTVPIEAYYHGLYANAVVNASALLEIAENYEKVAEICKAAVRSEPYNEEIYRFLLRARIALGERETAAAEYEEMSKLLFTNFGIMPSDETRKLYREALRTISSHSVCAELMYEQLAEKPNDGGALICEYDFFRVLCQSQARMISRNGDVVHIALLSASGREKPLAGRSLNTVIENLSQQIKSCLRLGDAAAQCSATQFMIMLPQANFEDSNIVCERIIKSFFKKHPHSPAKIEYIVQPLQPVKI